MAREIRGASGSGTLYARIMNSSGLWWDGSTFVAYAAADYADYVVAMTEQGDSGVYVADFPSTISTGGTYEYYVHIQTGGSPVEGDNVINTGRIDWTGTSSIVAAAGSSSGSEFRDYVLRRSFKRTDKDTELYEATTDAIQEMRRRFSFSEAQIDTTTTDTITVAGDYRIAVESDLGLLLNVIVQDGENATLLEKKTKAQFDELYPFAASDPSSTGYPEHYCVYGGYIYIGPTPDRSTYVFRTNYSRRGGTITSSTTGVPFTDLYRDILADLVLSKLYDGLDEPDKANYYRSSFENGFQRATQRERRNSGVGHFNVIPMDC
jgi:hypothetical protein